MEPTIYTQLATRDPIFFHNLCDVASISGMGKSAQGQNMKIILNDHRLLCYCDVHPHFKF